MGLWRKIGSLVTFGISLRVYLHMTQCGEIRFCAKRMTSSCLGSLLKDGDISGEMVPVKGQIKGRIAELLS